MPTRHIDDKTWDKVREKTVDAVLETRESFKESEMLKMLILKGIHNITKEDFRAHLENKKK